VTEYSNVRSYLGGLIRRIVIPAPDGSDYLVRWQFPIGFRRACYVHKIVQSDGDRDLHDHPWNFISILVYGRYVEETPGGNKRLKNWFNPHRATDLHRVQLFKRNGKEIPVYTVVIRGKRLRDWGFQTADGWKTWRDYNAEKFGSEVV